MLRRLVLSLTLTLAGISAFSQSGTIKGNVKDASTGEAVIGANVLVAGTNQGASADTNGAFEITKIKAGTYTLVVSFISFKSDTIKVVVVYPDETTVVNTTLVDESRQLADVIVTGAKITNTDISVITELRKNDLVAVGISAQQISMSQDRDAAQIMKRIPGITIVNNKFVNVRGLSERYSTVMLNGIIAPSTEVDSKAFAFDLIPSNLLDRMLVYKSGSPELPGEFAGADISIYTKNVVEENSISISVSGSYRNNTTGKNVALSQEKDSKDWLGGDGGIRKLPQNFPGNLREIPTEQNQKIVDATKILPNTWGTRNLKASPDYRINLDLSRTMRIAGIKLDNISSLSYAHTNQRLEASQNWYDAFSIDNKKSTPRYLYNDVRFAQTNRLGAISNFTLNLSPIHRIEFRNFYNQQGQNQSTFRTGTANALQYDVKNLSYTYSARSIYSGQLSGKHSLSNTVGFNWIFGYNNTTANLPDYRKIGSQRDMGTDNPFSIVIPPGASSFDAGRFYSKLKENTYSAAGNLEIKLNPNVDVENQAKITTGYYLEQKDRSFSARWMSYAWRNSDVIDNSLLLGTYDQLFVPANLGSKFTLQEGTNVGGGSSDPTKGSYDKYDGYNKLLAGYIGIVTPFAKKFRVSSGLRVEHNIQRIDVYGEKDIKVNVVNRPITTPMPFLNLSYNVSEKMLLRIAYSKTVNRPVFREIAPFNFYDFDRNADIRGNSNLKTATIDNIDLSWELYPSKSEKISLGVFYKNFKNPIEQIYSGSGGGLAYGFANADQAQNYGIEAEIRKSLDNTSSSFLKKFTLVFNGALINSKIKFSNSNDLTDSIELKRSLQGQSPYVANASVYYNDYEKGLQISVQYNVFGKRIFAVGDKSSVQNQYEMPRNQIDFTVSKRLTSHFEVKAGIQDILNQRYRLIQDSNRDRKITSVDEAIQVYRWGQYGTLGIIWKL